MKIINNKGKKMTIDNVSKHFTIGKKIIIKRMYLNEEITIKDIKKEKGYLLINNSFLVNDGTEEIQSDNTKQDIELTQQYKKIYSWIIK